MHILTIGMVLIFIYTIQRIKIHQNRCSVNFYDGCFILKPIACLSLIMLAGNVGNWAISVIHISSASTTVVIQLPPLAAAMSSPGVVAGL